MHPLEHRPTSADHPASFGSYVDRVPAGRLDDLLRAQIADVDALVERFPGPRETSAYAPGKWTVRQVAQHIADTERVLAYRLLRLARSDGEVVAGMDHDAFAAEDGSAGRPLAAICDEFAHLRRASIALLVGTDPALFDRRCDAWRRPITFLAQAIVLYGHADHHLTILRERY